MSVAAIPSPVSRCKRLYEGEGVDASGHTGLDGSRHKRHRVHRSPQPLGGGQRFHPNVVAALLVLFPGMDERVVQEVLVECNHSIDAAIRRLTDLRLSTEDATVAAATAAAASTAQSDLPGTGAGLSVDGEGEDAVSAAAAAAAQQPSTAADGPAPGSPQTAEQWIDFLVSEMLAAKDMVDARTRAAGVLQHFERFVKQRAKSEADAKLADLVKENTIYKRAVQIQASRMQAKAGLEEEVTGLRGALAQYQEQCRRLELHNYSLAMHLQQATSSGAGAGGHYTRNPPDVF